MASGGWLDYSPDIIEESEPSEDSARYSSDRTRSVDHRSPLRMGSPVPSHHSSDSQSSDYDPDYEPPVLPPALMRSKEKGKGPKIRHTARKQVRFPPAGFREMHVDSAVPPPSGPGESSRRDPTPPPVPRRASIDIPMDPVPEPPSDRHALFHCLEAEFLEANWHARNRDLQVRAELAQIQAELRGLKSKKGFFSSVWGWIRGKK